MWEFIDKIVYINLDKRPDRDEYMKSVTSILPSEKVVRFSAIESNPGSIGCTKSHIAVMKMALENKWSNVLILEDDVTWNQMEKGYNLLEQLASKDYDVIHLGPSNAEYDVNTFRIYNGYTTSSYLVNASYLPTLLSNFEEGLQLLIDTNKTNIYVCDRYWNSLMLKDNWYACMPCLMYQKAGYSDIDLAVKSDQSWFWTMNPNFINVELHGGLGNQLFQLAFLDYVSRTNSAIPFLEHTNSVSTHSKQSYFNNIFKKWKCMEKSDVKIHKYMKEYNLQPQKWQFDTQENIKIHGYFHNWAYIDPTFYAKLDFSSSFSMLEKYPNIEKCVFIHIRGGDYLISSNKGIYDVGLYIYYQKAIQRFPSNTKFVIFTNDRQYANRWPFLREIHHQFIDENEVDSLFLMSKCAGGICANSSFSWWGGVLNLCNFGPTRIITVPSKWYTDTNLYSQGYYLNYFTVINTDTHTIRFNNGKLRFI